MIKKNLKIKENVINTICNNENISWENILFQNDIKIQKWAQHDNIMSCEILFIEAETQKISVKQEKMTKKFSIRLKLIKYKYIYMYLLRIFHHLEKKQKELTKMSWWLFIINMYQILSHQFFITEKQVVWKIMLLIL